MKNDKRTSYCAISTNRHARTSFAVQAGMVVGIVLLCALLLVFGVGKSRASVNVSLPVGPGSLNHPKGWCGQQGQPVCRSSPDWLSAASEQPGEIAHVITSSPEYAMLQKRAGYAMLDTPTLIHPLNAHTGISYYDLDHWVASARSTTGVRVGLFDFVYDSTAKRLRFASFGVITPGDARAHMAFPYVMGTQVLAKLQHQSGVHVMATSRPELVFFLIDPRYRNLNSHKYRWDGGGDSPMNPLWHVTGAAGSDYFVGLDLHTYTRSMVKPLIVR
ncbi:MAG: hypothetical protein JO031_00140 [Ktedonobacteraceae bacterium]|nr:hypothetical protein [Ktedonobacteraceae bacterium]